VRAVIFDLWETLIDWDQQAATRMVERIDALAGPGFRQRWYESPHRYTKPVRTVLAEVGIPAEVMDEVCEIRLDYVRHCLVPRDGVIETLHELRRRGQLTGLITVCSQDVETLWPDSAFAGLFDAEVFSSRLGISKPDPRIYLHCCELLGVDPHEAVFVGDGANDELGGAERIGMEAILIHPPDEEPMWEEARSFQGRRVTSIPAVLDLV
jgi:putative hydrolase of the HAD superfamily